MAIVFKKDLDNPFSFDVAGPSIIFMIAMIPIFCFILVLYELKAFRFKCLNRDREERNGNNFQSIVENHIDEDITEEERRVESANPESLTVMVDKIKKFYGPTPAVRKVSFGLEYGECFALLGVSGAGKTTTFKCLTGEEVPSQGQVRIQGFDVSTSAGFSQARNLIGYCPQFDAIFERLTVREHLEFYAAVKGILADYRERLIEKQLEDMDLKEFENVFAENLSGGNKRKLSVAMALIGNPPIVFLDEPSTGVDPKAKRFMWTIVSKISTQRKKSSVIITTHSMEEAEALCTKMGIMVAGRFKCFGSS
jgi:ATP-binding cassette, subfamily A (ABC1), member 3